MRAGALIAASLARADDMASLVARGVAPPNVFRSSELAPALPRHLELIVAVCNHLNEAPDRETARRRLRAVVNAMPVPGTGQLLKLRIAAEMALRANAVRFRDIEAKALDYALKQYCEELRQADRDLVLASTLPAPPVDAAPAAPPIPALEVERA